jgi:hypothetical protein
LLRIRFVIVELKLESSKYYTVTLLLSTNWWFCNVTMLQQIDLFFCSSLHLNWDTLSNKNGCLLGFVSCLLVVKLLLAMIYREYHRKGIVHIN